MTWNDLAFILNIGLLLAAIYGNYLVMRAAWRESKKPGASLMPMIYGSSAGLMVPLFALLILFSCGLATALNAGE